MSPQFAGGNDSLVAALTKTQSAYKKLASAAKAESSKRYKEAQKQVSSSEAAVNRAIDSLKQ